MRACKAGIVEDLRFFLRLESTAAAIADQRVAVCRKVGASSHVFPFPLAARRAVHADFSKRRSDRASRFGPVCASSERRLGASFHKGVQFPLGRKIKTYRGSGFKPLIIKVTTLTKILSVPLLGFKAPVGSRCIAPQDRRATNQALASSRSLVTPANATLGHAVMEPDPNAVDRVGKATHRTDRF